MAKIIGYLVLAVQAVLAAVVVAADPQPLQADLSDGGLLYRRLPVYGAPLQGVRYGDQPSDGLATTEAMGWRSIYDSPFIVAVQVDGKNEIAGFFVTEGLRSLARSDDMRILHSLLLTGQDKVGVLLSGTNYVSLPHVDMPITSFTMPRGFSLADSARLHAAFFSFPTVLLVDRESVNPRDLVRLAMVGEFTVLPDSIKVSQDIPAPAARWSKRFTPGYSAVSQATRFSPAVGPSLSPLDLALSSTNSFANPFLNRYQ